MVMALPQERRTLPAKYCRHKNLPSLLIFAYTAIPQPRHDAPGYKHLKRMHTMPLTPTKMTATNSRKKKTNRSSLNGTSLWKTYPLINIHNHSRKHLNVKGLNTYLFLNAEIEKCFQICRDLFP